MLRFETAGESHGECLVATLTGLPSGVPVSVDYLDRQLWRRQQGFGRGGRMKIETDQARIVAGVRHSQTIGSPIALLIENKDWKNWQTILPVEAKNADPSKDKPVIRPRPGHADLPGAIKYNYADARYILERASARETTARVAIGALAKTFLSQFGIEVLSHVVGVGPVRLERPARVVRNRRAQPARRRSARLRRRCYGSAYERGCRSRLSHWRHRRRRL